MATKGIKGTRGTKRAERWETTKARGHCVIGKARNQKICFVLFVVHPHGAQVAPDIEKEKTSRSPPKRLAPLRIFQKAPLFIIHGVHIVTLHVYPIPVALQTIRASPKWFQCVAFHFELQ